MLEPIFEPWLISSMVPSASTFADNIDHVWELIFWIVGFWFVQPEVPGLVVNEYATMRGTSMATPHTSGAVALVRALHPDQTPSEIKSMLMTTATTVLGLTPMALGLGDGAEIRTPMAIAVISGLITSTALTLIVIPSIYVLADKLKMRMLGTETVARGAGDGAALSAPGVDTVTP